MRLKNGVSIRGIKPEMVLALTIAAKVYERYGLTLTITAVTDGKHRPGSLHYVGLAADLRLPGSPADPTPPTSKELVANLQKALGSEFDVVLEADHIHVEYQPKG